MKCPSCKREMHIVQYGWLRLIDVYVCKNSHCIFNGVERNIPIKEKEAHPEK